MSGTSTKYESNPLVAPGIQVEETELPQFGQRLEGLSPSSPGTEKKKKKKKKKKDKRPEEAEILSDEDYDEADDIAFPLHPDEREKEVVIIGAAGTGKSALAMRFCADYFPKKYEPTISEKYTKKLVVGKQPVLLNILDTAGQDEYNVLPEEYLQMGDGFLVVYNPSSMTSFEKLDSMWEDLGAYREPGEEVPVVLVANKCDLPNRVVEIEEVEDKILTWEEKTVQKKKGKKGRRSKRTTVETAPKLHLMEHVECSALQNEGVALAFDTIVDALVRKHQSKLKMANSDDGTMYDMPDNSWCSSCNVS